MRLKAFIFLLSFCFPPFIHAQSGGGRGGSFQMGIVGGKTSAEQKHLNTLQTRANTRAGGISVGDLDSAWEYGAFMQWRFGFLGLQFRGTWLNQSEDGKDSDGNTYKYSVQGQTGAVIFRLYPLESGEIKLAFQTGVAWGRASTEIKEGDFTAKASGSNLGYMVGVAVEIVLAGSHGITLEGGWRYLPILQLYVDSSSGTPDGQSATQYSKNSELEFDNRDLGVTMTGSQLLVAYSFHF